MRHDATRSFARYVQIAVQLQAGHALEAGIHQVDGDRPYLQTQVGAVHQGVVPHREVLAAVPASVRLRLARGALLDVQGAALRAADTIGPTYLDEPRLGRGIVRNIWNSSTSEMPSR